MKHVFFFKLPHETKYFLKLSRHNLLFFVAVKTTVSCGSFLKTKSFHVVVLKKFLFHVAVLKNVLFHVAVKKKCFMWQLKKKNMFHVAVLTIFCFMWQF